MISMGHPRSGVLLEVRDLQTHFFTDDGIVRAVDHVNLMVREGEAVGLVGESGCGKSMTARSIMGLVPSPAGRIVGGAIFLRTQDLLSLNENAMRGIRGSRIAMVFQDPMTYLNPIMTVGDQIKEAIWLHRGLRGNSLREATTEALRRARVPSPEDVMDYYPHQLSGGMRQRVLIAIAISCEPELLIADEPTTALDVTIQAQILQLLKNIVAEMNMALILISHDLGIVADVCERVYVMYAGQIVEQATAVHLYESPRHPYTQGLLSVAKSITGRRQAFPTISGSVPDLLNPPSGCRFHPRCPSAMPICEDSDPMDLRLKDNRGEVACWLHIPQAS
jgi:oligopeptide/dipeptide ABC transporter ATP-binding protein